jgi:exopolyphosphatase / guanosine-5'-triphosphate,3'-diphosphate pyrophosphatase
MNTRQEEAKPLDAVRALAMKLDPEPEHPLQVTRLALELFDKTLALHRLGPAERRLLEAAALLHDTGYRKSALRHHKHSRDIILKQDLPGFSELERKQIALIARYHRGATPKPGHRFFCDLDDAAKDRVSKLAAILRVADGLDRVHLASVESLEVLQAGGTLRIGVHQRHPCPEDLEAGLKKRVLFEEVFGVKVAIVSAKGNVG